jgi:hypothetical protein
VIERIPHGGPDHERMLGVVVPDFSVTHIDRVTLANRLPSPLISSNVYENADQPGLFIRESAGNRLG